MLDCNNISTPNNEYYPDITAEMHSVPNVMNDDVQHTVQQGILQIQQGTIAYPNVNDNIQPNTIPIYAVDGGVTQFEIPDHNLRRAFVQKCFVILILQNIIVLPAIEIFNWFVDEPIAIHLYGAFLILGLIIFALMYVFSEHRRYAPMNIIALITVSMFWIGQKCFYATQIGNKQAIIAQFVIILQLTAIYLYSQQNRFKFSIINAILFIIIIFLMAILILIISGETTIFGIAFGAIIDVIYFVYDMQLMLSGHHGYNLQPEEHVFANTNLYVDCTNLFWRLFKYTFVSPFMRSYHFISQCCSAEVC